MIKEARTSVSAPLVSRRRRWLLGQPQSRDLSWSEDLPVPDWAPIKGRVGVCLSGGGIRSAAYNLGVLQELQRRGLLNKAEYLAAVSGGAYIAGAFEIALRETDAELIDEQDVFAPGSPEEQHLRNHSDYLAPALAGKFRLMFTLTLSLLINCLLIGLAAFLMARPLGWAYARWYDRFHFANWLLAHKVSAANALPASSTAVHAFVVPANCAVNNPPPDCTSQITLGLNQYLVWGLVAVAGLGVLATLVNLLLRPRGTLRLFYFLDAWSLRLLVIAGTAAFLSVGLPELVVLARNVLDLSDLARAAATTAVGRDAVSIATQTGKVSRSAGASVALKAFTGGGIVTTLSALYLQVRSATRSEVVSEGKKAIDQFKKLPARLRRAFITLVSGLVGPLAIVAVIVTMTNEAAARGLTWAEGRNWLICAIFVGSLYFLGDMTAWSMHPFYKRRLCSAFCIRRARDAARHPIAEVIGDTSVLPLAPTQPTSRPKVLFCAAAHISDPGVTPPGPGATSFVFGPDWVGGPLVGYIATSVLPRKEDKGDPAGHLITRLVVRGAAKVGWSPSKRKARDFTLPAAMAISGSAIAPSMRKDNRRSLTFLHAISNARLGVWLPNPRRFHEWNKQRLPHNARLQYLLKELVGGSRLHDKFLYVNDGAHYENFGLVELLRRGCTDIYCFDASGDHVDTHFALGQAVALARSEIGAEIDINPDPMRPIAGDPLYCGTDHVIGTITFPYAKPAVSGHLYFAKADVTRGAPFDVRAYREKDHTFPTGSTADELYTDAKFEAFRALGRHAAAQAISPAVPCKPIANVPQAVKDLASRDH